jgi:hypothetical protein
MGMTFLKSFLKPISLLAWREMELTLVLKMIKEATLISMRGQRARKVRKKMMTAMITS